MDGTVWFPATTIWIRFLPWGKGYLRPALPVAPRIWGTANSVRCVADTLDMSLPDGDEIFVDVDSGKLELHVSEEEIARRLAAWKLPAKELPRGYLRMYAKRASSADEGVVIKV